ncbi:MULTISPECIES: hypothetical protein [Streptomyces albidoflavus group]|uniref:Antirepressor protein C-terminal domain-containing protein n=1 Tax=Streptomyces odorifer TaxID=53450 RepID=A0A7Y6F507_9ACTN|nr:hypothetical protein [Streptomyces odorifer]NUV31995.1 hypothetical protein [Streptomyces odorifer]
MLPIMPDQPNELVLTESRTMRAQTAGRVDVLDKVKALALLPDGVHATTEIVASYYEVGIEAIKSLVKDNRAELEGNGYRVLAGAERAEFVRSQQDLTLPPARHLATFTRRTILNVGQLLTESDVARQVRTYLLDVEEAATPEQKVTAVEKATEAEAQLRAIEVLARIDGNTSYARSLSRHIAARMLGEEPELDPADVTITCDEYLDGRIAAGDMASARTRMGRTVAALYRARYGADPQKIKRPIHGVHRDVAVYTHRDLDLFDTAWTEVSRHYNVQDRIALGGAA